MSKCSLDSYQNRECPVAPAAFRRSDGTRQIDETTGELGENDDERELWEGTDVRSAIEGHGVALERQAAVSIPKV